MHSLRARTGPETSRPIQSHLVKALKKSCSAEAWAHKAFLNKWDHRHTFAGAGLFEV